MRGLQARSDLQSDHRETATLKFGYVIKTKHWCCHNLETPQTTERIIRFLTGIENFLSEYQQIFLDLK